MTEQLPSQSQDSAEGYARNLALMNQIVAQMKEIPILPSEQPKDVSGLEKVMFPEEGGILTYMDGHPEPYKGFPFYEFVDKIDYMKKLSRGIISGLYHTLKRKPKLLFLTLIPGIWIIKSVVTSAVYSLYRIVERIRIKPEIYCDSVRELYRAFSYEDDDEKTKDREFRLQLRDLICMVLEFDNAYRFRFQDIIEDLDQEAVQKNVSKELVRLLNIMSRRERTQDVSDTWTLVRLFIKYYLTFDLRLKRILKTVLLRLEVKKVLLSKEDIHFCEKRQDYTFKHYECNRVLS